MGFQSVNRRFIDWLSEKGALVAVLLDLLNDVCDHFSGQTISILHHDCSPILLATSITLQTYWQCWAHCWAVVGLGLGADGVEDLLENLASSKPLQRCRQLKTNGFGVGGGA